MLFVARIEIKRRSSVNRHFLVSIRRKNIGYSTSEMPAPTHLKRTRMIKKALSANDFQA
jgi:hypothetical protein